MSIRLLFQKTSQSLLDFFLPPHCLNCKTLGDWLCQHCLNDIALITEAVCEQCGEPLTETASSCSRCRSDSMVALDGVRAAAYFENNPIRPAIHFLKYNNHRAVSSSLAKLLSDAYSRYGLQAEVIIPVPLHPSRLEERGYNQSELLARALSDNLKLPMDSATLQRVRHTRPQVGLGLLERQENVVDAFLCADQKLAGQHILLIDDVWTTGSTMNACASALKKTGVASVWGLTLAKAGPAP